MSNVAQSLPTGNNLRDMQNVALDPEITASSPPSKVTQMESPWFRLLKQVRCLEQHPAGQVVVSVNTYLYVASAWVMRWVPCLSSADLVHGCHER